MARGKINVKGIVVIIVAAVVFIGGFGTLGWYLDSRRNDNSGNTASNNAVIPTSNFSIALDPWVGFRELAATGEKYNTKFFEASKYADIAKMIISGDVVAGAYPLSGFIQARELVRKEGKDLAVVLWIDASVGADGIVAKDGIKNARDLAQPGIKIASTEGAPNETLLEHLRTNSDLTTAEMIQFKNNIVNYDDGGDAGAAFMAGKVDAAGTWEPYLTDVVTEKTGHVLFDTSMAQTLLVNVLFVETEWLAKNEAFVKKFVSAYCENVDSGTPHWDALKVFSWFKPMPTEEIVLYGDGVTYKGLADNYKFFNTDEGKQAYMRLADVLVASGTNIDLKGADTFRWNTDIYDKGEATAEKATRAPIVIENVGQILEASDNEALISHVSRVQFASNSSIPNVDVDKLNEYLNLGNLLEIEDNDEKKLAEFIRIALGLDGMIVRIVGHTHPVQGSDGVAFSRTRAQSIANLFIQAGIDADRIIVDGMGDKEAALDKNGDNRRVTISFFAPGW